MLLLSRGIRVKIGDRAGRPVFDLMLYEVDRLEVSRWLLARILTRKGIDPERFSWLCGDMIVPLPSMH